MGHLIEANLLNPQIMGNSSHLQPLIGIVALLAAEGGFGLAGALLAVPAASILWTLFEFAREQFFSRPADPAPETG